MNALRASETEWSNVTNVEQKANVLKSFDTVFQHIDTILQDDVKTYARQLKADIKEWITNATPISIAGVKEIVVNLQALLFTALTNEVLTLESKDLDRMQQHIKKAIDVMRQRSARQGDVEALEKSFEEAQRKAETKAFQQKLLDAQSDFEVFFNKLNAYVERYHKSDKNVEELAKYIMYKLPPITNIFDKSVYARTVGFLPKGETAQPPHTMNEIKERREKVVEVEFNLRDVMLYNDANDTIWKIFLYHMKQYLKALQTPELVTEILKETRTETENRLK